MNRQRFLAELRRLLVYMTEEDREEAVRRCAEAFDAAGAEGEADMIAVLGSPTRAAIALSRGYEPGMVPDVLPKTVVAKPHDVETETAELPPEPEVTWTDLPEFALPSIDGEEPAAPEGDEAVPAPEPAVPASEARKPEPAAQNKAPVAASAPKDGDELAGDDMDEEPGVIVERTMSLGVGVPLFVLVFGALGLPLGALCLALTLALLAPGCAVLFGAYLVFVGGLWCTGYMADAVLLFGLAFVVLAAGLLLLCLGLWAAVKLWTVYGRGVGWVAGELLGRKVQADA